jgi:hypothetical protein
MKVIRSSPLCTGRVYPQEAQSTPGHMVPSVATGKIPSETTGDRSRDPPTGSAVYKIVTYVFYSKHLHVSVTLVTIFSVFDSINTRTTTEISL